MNRSLLVATVCVVSAWAATPCSAQTNPMSALQALGSSLRSSEAWRADYQQEYIAAGMIGGELVAGSVVTAWPHNALFLTGDPLIQQMGLDGRVVRLIDLEVGSCDEHQLDDDEWSRIPLAAVLDPSSAVEHFTVLEHGDNGFVLVPREAGGVDRVEVTLSEDHLPVEIVIVDPQGATNRLQFENWQKTEPPAGRAWLPDPPPGVKCIVDTP